MRRQNIEYGQSIGYRQAAVYRPTRHHPGNHERRQDIRTIIGRRWAVALVAMAAFVAASATAQNTRDIPDGTPIDATLIEKIVFLSEADAHLEGAIATRCQTTGCDAALVTPLLRAAIGAMEPEELTEEIDARARETDDAAWAIARFARATQRLQED